MLIFLDSKIFRLYKLVYSHLDDSINECKCSDEAEVTEISFVNRSEHTGK